MDSMRFFKLLSNRKEKTIPIEIKRLRQRALRLIGKAEIATEFAKGALPVDFKQYMMLSNTKYKGSKNNSISLIGDSIIRVKNTVDLLNAAMSRYETKRDLTRFETYIKILEIELKFINDIFTYKRNLIEESEE